MGTTTRLEYAKFCIKKENFDLAFQHLQGLAKTSIAKARISTGRSSSSSVDQAKVLAAPTLPDQLRAWRWPCKMDDAGNICGIDFAGEKEGEEDMLFEALGPFVEKDSCIEMRNENGWRLSWQFDGLTCGSF